MEDRQLPIYFESGWGALKEKRWGKIIRIYPKTLCLRVYEIVWFVEGFPLAEHSFYRGARSRPSWIHHIFRTREDWEKAMQGDVKL